MGFDFQITPISLSYVVEITCFLEKLCIPAISDGPSSSIYHPCHCLAKVQEPFRPWAVWAVAEQLAAGKDHPPADFQGTLG